MLLGFWRKKGVLVAVGVIDVVASQPFLATDRPSFFFFCAANATKASLRTFAPVAITLSKHAMRASRHHGLKERVYATRKMALRGNLQRVAVDDGWWIQSEKKMGLQRTEIEKRFSCAGSGGRHVERKGGSCP